MALIVMPPAPGAPSLWLGMVLAAVALEAAATLELRQHGTPPRIIGAVVTQPQLRRARAFVLELRELLDGGHGEQP